MYTIGVSSQFVAFTDSVSIAIQWP